MSVSALAQENVLSETWGQKLDLTIPSSEMPSTWVLDSKARHAIMRGWTCCYHNELLASVQNTHLEKSIQLKLKASQNRLTSIPFRERQPVHEYTWYLFWTLQALDVWTTNEGMKYDCVYEQNPLLPKVPHLDRILIHKAIFLHPFTLFQSEDVLDQRDMWLPTALSMYVVHNNFEVIDRAKRNCQKR